MDRINLYRTFVRVVETRSFTRAADTLHMPRSSVSSAIAALEAQIGARLLNRTTRTVTPSDEGIAFYERCLAFLAEADEMETMFLTAPNQIEGRIRVDVPGRIGRLIIAPALPEFLAQWPGLRVELGMTDRTVDLVSERVDCALRIGVLADSTLMARKLGDLVQVNVASPEYLANNGVPLIPADLDHHYQVAYASPSSGRVADWGWQEAGQALSRSVSWRVSANSAEGYIACAVAGLGLIQIPAYDVADNITAGELVEIMPSYKPAPMPMSLVFASRSRALRRLETFAAWLEDVLSNTIKY